MSPFDRPRAPDRLGTLLRCPRCAGRGWHIHPGPTDWTAVSEPEHASTEDCAACDGTGYLALPPTQEDVERFERLEIDCRGVDLFLGV